MNERIRELIQQAGTDCSGKWMGMNHAEKFAELIVRECAEVASDPLSFTEAAYCRVGLLKHFGIEK